MKKQRQRVPFPPACFSSPEGNRFIFSCFFLLVPHLQQLYRVPQQPWLAMANFTRLVWITVVAVLLPLLMVLAMWTSVTSDVRSESENLPRFDGWIQDENRIAILMAGSLQRFNLNTNLERLVSPLVRENWTVDLYLSIRMGKVQGWRQAADAFEPEGELKNLNQEGLETLLTWKVSQFGGTLVYQHIFDEIDLAVEDIDFIQNFGQIFELVSVFFFGWWGVCVLFLGASFLNLREQDFTDAKFSTFPKTSIGTMEKMVLNPSPSLGCKMGPCQFNPWKWPCKRVSLGKKATYRAITGGVIVQTSFSPLRPW